MKILLVGDYSGVHTELAKALRELNHEVIVISGGDGYKDFPRDINIPELAHTSLILKLLAVFFDFLGLKGIVRYFSYRKQISKLTDFEVVQLMNPIALPA